MENSTAEPVSGSVSSSSTAVNPMLNQAILDILFSACDPNDLAQLRLVSRGWHRASLKSWRSRVTLIFLDPAARRTSSTSNNGTPLDQFMRLVRGKEEFSGLLALANKPFSSFYLIRWPLETKHNHPDDPSPNHSQFWSLCGPWIKRLRLDACSCVDFRSFRDILFRMTPNLEELKIDGLDTDPMEDDDELYDPPAIFEGRDALPVQNNLKVLHVRCSDGWPIRWSDLINGFPKMKELMLVEVDSNLLQILIAIANARKAGKQIYLRHLEITMNYLDDGNINLSADPFRDAKLLCVQILKISFIEGIDESVIRQLIQQSSPTLRTLTCARVPRDSNSPHPTPFRDFLGEAYEQLKDLRLNGALAPNFGFLRNTPNLEILYLDYYTDEKLDNGLARLGMTEYEREVLPARDAFRPEAGVRIDTLVEFRTWRRFDNNQAFLNITKWMPNVTRLSAPLTRLTFPLACSVWKSTLQELHITREGTIGDEIITGLGIRRGGEGDAIIHDRPPNITDLQELRKFTQDQGSGGFTEHAVLYGFRWLAKLKTLKMFVTEELSVDVLEILKSQNVELSWTKWQE